MKRTLTDELWQLGALVELPRDMHCTHGPAEKDGLAPAGSASCPECGQVSEVLEALRNERPS